MSTDFIALFDISLEKVNPERLLAQLMASPEFATRIVERYRNLWRIRAWTIEISARESELLGPGGFAIRFKRRTLEMYHMMPFSTFTGDASCRQELRNACLSMATFVGSPRAIYTHELMPYQGEGLVQIESGLLERVGPPATTFEELHAAEFFGPRAWYIDTFDDLRCA